MLYWLIRNLKLCVRFIFPEVVAADRRGDGAGSNTAYDYEDDGIRRCGDEARRSRDRPTVDSSSSFL
jgi:hypothetical protein